MLKNTLLTILVFLLFQRIEPVQAQEFLFSIVFIDAEGNTDTIAVGYDENATENVDFEFGEIDIKTTPWDSIFEVRITPEINHWNAEPIQYYHLKRQIVKKECDLIYPIPIEIDIKAIHWPVTAIWNSDLFENTCNEGSLITSFSPGGWWDTGSPSDLGVVIFSTDSMVSFSDNVDYNGNLGLNTNYAYEDSIAGLISVFWVGLGKEGLGVSTKEQEMNSQVEVYPNPNG